MRYRQVYEVEVFFPEFLGIQFTGPVQQTRVLETQVVDYEPGYFVDEYVEYYPYWAPVVTVGFGFPVILY